MIKAKDRIIFPLDVATREQAGHFISLLSGRVGMFKVGLELFISCGPDIVRDIHKAGDTRIFLDLKLHDIPETVKRAAKAAGELNVHFLTVHCGESLNMLEAAVEGASGKTDILGITVLTSVGKEDIRAAGYRKSFADNIAELVALKAKNAEKAGCAGVVSSALETPMIKKICRSEFLSVTPGIRPLWQADKKDDQTRITTPAIAMKNGSDYIVIGRPIRDAADPVEAAEKIADEISSVTG